MTLSPSIMAVKYAAVLGALLAIGGMSAYLAVDQTPRLQFVETLDRAEQARTWRPDATALCSQGSIERQTIQVEGLFGSGTGYTEVISCRSNANAQLPVELAIALLGSGLFMIAMLGFLFVQH